MMGTLIALHSRKSALCLTRNKRTKVACGEKVKKSASGPVAWPTAIGHAMVQNIAALQLLKVGTREVKLVTGQCGLDFNRQRDQQPGPPRQAFVRRGVIQDIQAHHKPRHLRGNHDRENTGHCAQFPFFEVDNERSGRYLDTRNEFCQGHALPL
jgi:hypothetical protein